MYEYILKVGCEGGRWMERVEDYFLFQNLGVAGVEAYAFISKCFVGLLVGWTVSYFNWLTNFCFGHLRLLMDIQFICEPLIVIVIDCGFSWMHMLSFMLCKVKY
jgi:hypothetical protein